MKVELIIAVCTGLLATTPVHAIDAKYRKKLERSGCTQLSEMQGCDINKTEAENVRAGFVTGPDMHSPYAGNWIAIGPCGGTLTDIRSNNKKHVTVNSEVVKPKRSDGALVFTQGLITYTIQGDRNLNDEDYWYESGTGVKGSIYAK